MDATVDLVKEHDLRRRIASFGERKIQPMFECNEENEYRGSHGYRIEGVRSVWSLYAHGSRITYLWLASLGRSRLLYVYLFDNSCGIQA